MTNATRPEASAGEAKPPVAQSAVTKRRTKNLDIMPNCYGPDHLARVHSVQCKPPAGSDNVAAAGPSDPVHGGGRSIPSRTSRGDLLKGSLSHETPSLFGAGAAEVTALFGSPAANTAATTAGGEIEEILALLGAFKNEGRCE